MFGFEPAAEPGGTIELPSKHLGSYEVILVLSDMSSESNLNRNLPMKRQMLSRIDGLENYTGLCKRPSSGNRRFPEVQE